MQLHATVSASEFDEHYQMAYVYCRDIKTGYCFSLSRFPGEEGIEIMVLDQVTTKVPDLSVIFTGNTISAELAPAVASQLDGQTRYEVHLDNIGNRMSDVRAALHKIFENKNGFQDFSAT